MTLDRDGVVAFIEEFVADWAYHRMLPTLAEKFTHIEDPAEAAAPRQPATRAARPAGALELGDRDPLAIDWRGDEGRDSSTGHRDAYEHMEDLEP